MNDLPLICGKCNYIKYSALEYPCYQCKGMGRYFVPKGCLGTVSEEEIWN